MQHKSQQQMVLDRLLATGWINEAYAQRRKIKRLPSLIHRIRGMGYTILAVRSGRSTTYLIGKP